MADPARRTVVGIDGFSGSGKTTLAERMGRRPDTTVVSIEQFYLGWSGLEEGVRRAREQLVDPFLAGEVPVVRPWDWAAGREGPPVRLVLAPTVVLEGCGAGARLLRGRQALTIWVRADADERERRLRARADWPDHAPHRVAFDRRERSLAARDRTREEADALVTIDEDGAVDVVRGEVDPAWWVPSSP